MDDSSHIYLSKVSKFIDWVATDRSFYRNKRLCVCLSGGADSVSLLVALYMLKAEYGYKLYAAHVNHLLRGKESDRDEKFCVDLCNSLNIELFLTRIDIKTLAKKSKNSVEETARNARYGYFNELGKAKNIDYFATAHTKNDNAETVIMNITRGTTVSGIRGIPKINHNILRPLLYISREENMDFLKQNNYSFVTDSSNQDIDITRNYVRKIVLPTMKKINSKVVDAVCRLSDSATADEDFFKNYISTLPTDIKDSELHPSVLRRILQNRYSEFTGGKSLMTKHLDALISLSGGENKRLDVSGGIVAEYNNGFYSFKIKNAKIIDYGIYSLNWGENKFANGKVTIVFAQNKSIFEGNIYNNYTQMGLYFDKIVGSIKYRARRTGDKIYCLGVNKSIKKEFITKHIPVSIRDIIPVFYDDNGIIYVPFIGAADRVYAKYEKKDTVYIKVCFTNRLNLTDRKRKAGFDNEE